MTGTLGLHPIPCQSIIAQRARNDQSNGCFSAALSAWRDMFSALSQWVVQPHSMEWDRTLDSLQVVMPLQCHSASISPFPPPSTPSPFAEQTEAHRAEGSYPLVGGMPRMAPPPPRAQRDRPPGGDVQDRSSIPNPSLTKWSSGGILRWHGLKKSKGKGSG